MATLNKFRKNLYSQDGEDGVLEEIFRRLSIHPGVFVEFGAWDGKHLSNTYALLEKNWKGVYIEADQTRFKELVRNTESQKENLELINAYVKPQGVHSLDNILFETNINKQFDLLSIDIDSFDWQIWQSLKNFTPKVVVIEINSAIPVGIYQTHRGGDIQGSSFSSTVALGQEKGYTPVCHTGNLVLLRNEYLNQLDLPETEILFPEVLFEFTGADSTSKCNS